MKVIDTKSYTKFLEKCDSNNTVLCKSHNNLSYSVLVQDKGQSTRFPIFPTNDFMACIDTFVNNLERAESITVEIQSNDRVMQAISYSFNPPKQATNMPTSDINSLLGSLPQAQQMLGTVMELNSKVERQALESDYKQKLQMLEFEKMLLKSQLERERAELERQRSNFEAEKRIFAKKVKAYKNKVSNYESEDRAIGHINIAKDVAKELLGGYLMIQAANTDSEKKEEKYITLAGLVTGAGALPEKQAEVASESYVSGSHDDKRKQAQIGIFQFLDSLDAANFAHVDKLLDFMCEPNNEALIKKYIIPLINYQLTE